MPTVRITTAVRDDIDVDLLARAVVQFAEAQGNTPEHHEPSGADDAGERRELKERS